MKRMAFRGNSNYSHWITHNYCKRPIKEAIEFVDVEGFDSFHFMDSDFSEEFHVNYTPSEDIWKKFELIPTPPLSPKHEQEINGSGIVSPRSTTDKLQLVSEQLDDPISFTVISDDFFLTPAIPPSNTPPGSSSSACLISDCMWSGQSRDGKPTDQLAAAKQKPVSRSEKADLTSFTTESSNSEDCVDPTSVFPFPISDAKIERCPLESKVETEVEDSDEEIDVVTVDKMRSILPVISRHPNSLLANSLIQAGPTLHISFEKHSNKVITLKRKSMSLPTSPEPSEKKLKRENSVPELSRLASPGKKVRVYRGPASDPLPAIRSPASDNEDLYYDTPGEGMEKRTQHNVLERKRRNDLKYSFMCLRDSIPQLEQQERAAKVVILQKAVECIEDLHLEFNELHRKRDQELRKREQLERKLALLQTEAYESYDCY